MTFRGTAALLLLLMAAAGCAAPRTPPSAPVAQPPSAALVDTQLARFYRVCNSLAAPAEMQRHAVANGFRPMQPGALASVRARGMPATGRPVEAAWVLEIGPQPGPVLFASHSAQICEFGIPGLRGQAAEQALDRFIATGIDRGVMVGARETMDGTTGQGQRLLTHRLRPVDGRQPGGDRNLVLSILRDGSALFLLVPAPRAR